MYEFNDLYVGVLICKDIEFAVFSRIGAYWFERNDIGPNFAGMHVAICNNTKFHQVRCASFVT